MSATRRAKFAPEQYLDFERSSEERHEYVDGEIFSFAGASDNHNLIAYNIGGTLHPQLRDRPCKAYIGDMRVRLDRNRAYAYPDVVVVCGEAQFEDDRRDTLLNPTVVSKWCPFQLKPMIAAQSSCSIRSCHH
jgi:Uma2 family endonuclease